MAEMRYGRALLAGMGWAGVLGGVALCVLIFLSAYLALDDAPRSVDPRKSKIVRLRPVPDAELPRVPLGRPPAGGGSPRSRANAPVTAPVQTPRAGATAPLPAQARQRPASTAGGGGAPQPTLGDRTSEVVGAVGTEVGRVSPPAGQVIQRTGDTLGDAVDTLLPRLQPLAPR